MNKKDRALVQAYSKLLTHPESFYLDSTYSLERFAEDMNLNRTYASRFANEVLGMPFRNLLQKLRANHAAELIKQRDMKVKDVAKASGFASEVSFRRAYMKEFGVKPSHDRKEK